MPSLCAQGASIRRWIRPCAPVGASEGQDALARGPSPPQGVLRGCAVGTPPTERSLRAVSGAAAFSTPPQGGSDRKGLATQITPPRMEQITQHIDSQQVRLDRGRAFGGKAFCLPCAPTGALSAGPQRGQRAGARQRRQDAFPPKGRRCSKAGSRYASQLLHGPMGSRAGHLRRESSEAL